MPTGSNSGSASDIRAGGAYVEVYARDRTAQDLEGIKAQLGAKFKEFGNDMRTKLTGSLNSGMKAGFAALGFGAIVEASKTIFQMANGMEKFNFAMEQGVKLSQRMAEINDKLRADVFEKIGGKATLNPGINPETGKLILETEEARKKYLEQQLDIAQRNLHGVGQRADKANDKTVELAAGHYGEFILAQKLPIVSDVLEIERKEAKQNADELNEERKKLRDHVAALREQLRNIEIKKWQVRLEVTANLHDSEKDLRDQATAMLMGMNGESPEEVAAFSKQAEALKRKVSLTTQDLEPFKRAFKDLEDIKAFKKQTDDLKAFDDELKTSLLTIGKTQDEIKLLRLAKDNAQAGISSKDLLGQANRRGIMAMIADANAIEEFKKLPLSPGASYVKGAFAKGDMGLKNELEFAEKWQAKGLNEAQRTNEWLREIAQKIRGPAVFK